MEEARLKVWVNVEVVAVAVKVTETEVPSIVAVQVLLPADEPKVMVLEESPPAVVAF